MRKLYTNVDLMATPVEDEHLVNKKYVDQAISRKVKNPVRVVATSDIDLSQPAPTTIDGVTLAKDDRVLLVGQTSADQNGVYTVVDDNGTLKLERAEDFTNQEDVYLNAMIPVMEGDDNADTTWVLTNDTVPTIGTDPLVFAKFKGQDYVSTFQGSFVGNDTDNDFTIAHGLGTENVHVQIFDKVTKSECLFDISIVDENNINVHADVVLTPTDEFIVVVMG